MACAVAAAVGGLTAAVIDGVTGPHIPPRQPERLAEESMALLADPVRQAGLGRAGARRARERYDWDLIAASTLEVHARMIRQTRRHDRPDSGRGRRLRAGPAPGGI
jgi:glycosyltransferase involved in cell wall biosynthesis